MAGPLDLARDAFARKAWAQARDAFAAAGTLERGDHQRLAIAAYLTGADEQCNQAWTDEHHAALAAGDIAEAARCAFWLGLCLMMRGHMAQAGGWIGRAESLVSETGLECAAAGYLRIPAVLGALDAGDADAASELARQTIEMAKRFDEADLHAFGVLGLGQALIAAGDIAGGMARLDEVMVAVSAAEVGPITSGIVYCAVILECIAVFDVPRAVEWTGALTDWCDAQPDLVPYRGQCLVHRSQLDLVAGRWADAVATVDAACQRLSDPPHPALGLAHYQQGELHRLAGAVDEAEEAYRQASRHGHDPVPGVALLELARGDIAAAAATIRRALHEGRSPVLLAAAADVLRAAGDVAGARAAADELAEYAANAQSDVLDAMAAQARGGVLIAEGEAAAALGDLRAAARVWQALHMPYDAARVAVLVGLACAALGDHAAAAREFDNARLTFADLGARPDLERLDALTGTSPEAGRAGLSGREVEVLTELAAGKTNREIAAALHISQHTVGRHVENVFAKLGVTNRAAATARAYELGLIARQ